MFILVTVLIIYFNLNYKKGSHTLLTSRTVKESSSQLKEVEDLIVKASGLLKARKDKEALHYFEQVLLMQPQNVKALWGKAEALRRSRKYDQAENLLKEILSSDPGHTSSLISLAFIMYKKERFKEAKLILESVLDNPSCNNDDRALAYTLLSMLANQEIKNAAMFTKIKQGNRIRGYLLKAKELAPELPEVHVGLGTFYLLAPKILGGDIRKATEELELAIRMAPDFATANARLAQLYKKKGDLERYNFYIKRTEELDPENEILEEIEKN
ncbi:MAG: tetratricopeptide repeat protein [Candidatus Omnitrophica bacterium]|nr:tetratricopeptide repeat protein [Candidatus Omnitrophota bacterium]